MRGSVLEHYGRPTPLFRFCGELRLHFLRS